MYGYFNRGYKKIEAGSGEGDKECYGKGIIIVTTLTKQE